MYLHAIVREKDKPLFVANITEAEKESLGEFGMELMAQEWCEKHNYTFIDFSI